MANTRTVIIDGREVNMRASALLPRLYRFKFGRDIIQDIGQLRKSYKKYMDLPEDATDEEREAAQLSIVDLSIFEDLAWLMIKHAGEEVPDTPDAWLESIDGIFSVYEVMPVIFDLWGESMRTMSVPKKK